MKIFPCLTTSSNHPPQQALIPYSSYTIQIIYSLTISTCFFFITIGLTFVESKEWTTSFVEGAISIQKSWDYNNNDSTFIINTEARGGWTTTTSSHGIIIVGSWWVIHKLHHNSNNCSNSNKILNTYSACATKTKTTIHINLNMMMLPPSHLVVMLTSNLGNSCSLGLHMQSCI